MKKRKQNPDKIGMIVAQLDIVVAALIRLIGEDKVRAEAEKVKKEILTVAKQRVIQCQKKK